MSFLKGVVDIWIKVKKRLEGQRGVVERRKSELRESCRSSLCRIGTPAYLPFHQLAKWHLHSLYQAASPDCRDICLHTNKHRDLLI